MKRRFPPSLLETLIKTPPARRVTQRSNQEVDPAAAGLTRDGVDRIWDAACSVYQSGLYPAVALCIRRRGHIILDRAIGHARGNGPRDPADADKELATPATLFNIFSASKSITAMLVHLLDDRGLLHIDDRVSEYIPEFAQHGKHKVTLRHVLSHRAGIPTIPSEHVDLDLLSDPKEIVGLLCDAPPVFVAGRRLAYHALTGGFILGEVIQRVTGKPLREVLREEILNPLGIRDMNYGVSADRVDKVALNAFTGPPIVPPLKQISRRALGVDYRPAIDLSNDRRFLTAVVPAGNIIATAEEVCRFYQLLLNGGELDGVRIFESRTIHRAVQEASWLEMDLTIGAPIRYGLGFVLGGKVVSIYGPRTSRAFGHLGFTNVFAWADPDRDLAACLMTTGKPLLSPRLFHTWNLLRTIGDVCFT